MVLHQVAPVAALWVARESARRGERHAVLPMMRKALDVLHQEGRLGWEVMGTELLVATERERRHRNQRGQCSPCVQSLEHFRINQDHSPSL